MLKNVGSNWLITILSICATYVLTPFFVRTLGTDGYGTWTLMTSMTGYLSLLILGVPLASVRYFSKHLAEGDHETMNRTVASCAGLYLLMGGAAALIGAGLFVAFATGYQTPPHWQSDARRAFLVVVLSICIGFPGILPEGIILAHRDFVARNLIRLGVLVLRFALSLLLLTFLPSLVVLAGIQVACTAADFSVSYLFIRRRYKEIRLDLSYFDWKVVKRILSFSLYVLMLNMGAYLSFSTDSLVIGAFMDVSRIPYYTIANSLFVYLMEFIIAIAAVVLPTATKLHAEGNIGELREMLLKWSKIAVSMTLLAGVFLLVLGPKFLAWWIDPSFEGSAGTVLRILIVSSLFFMPVRGIAQPMLMALGKVGFPTVAFLCAGMLNLGMSILLVPSLQLEGVALGTAVPTVLFSCAMVVFLCRQLGLPIFSYVRYVFVRPLLGGLPVCGVLVAYLGHSDVQGLAGLVIGGLVSGACFGIVWVFFVYKDDPYVKITRELLTSLAGRKT